MTDETNEPRFTDARSDVDDTVLLGRDPRPTDPTTSMPPAAPPLPEPPSDDDRRVGPVVRWAGILWGLVFAGIASTMLWVVVDAGRRDATSEWWESLAPGTITLLAVAAVGFLLLVAGTAGLLRRRPDRAPSTC
jgi:hypothetical protein